jgi:hypothetical protein
MGSHDPFGHLKHKLWLEERPRVKLAIWIPTTESRELTRCLACRWHATCRWKALDEGYNFALDLILIGGYSPAKSREFQPWQFWDSHFEVLGQKAIWMRASQSGVEYNIWWKVVASLESGPWWVLWIRSHPWLVLAPRVFQLCTNHFVLVLCRFVEVIEACPLFVVPSRSSSMPFYPSKVLRAKERAPSS